MPTYDFECNKCKKVIPKFYDMKKAPPHIKCPRCGRLMKRQIGTGAGHIYTDWFSRNKEGRARITKNNN